MRETVKLGVRLMLFALVAALMLAVVNGVTADPIAKNENRKMNAALVAVVGDYLFEPVEGDLTGYDKITAVYAAKDGAGATVGYAYELSVGGYGGAIKLSAGVRDGAVTAVSVSSHTETKGLGTSAQDTFLAAFQGIAANPDAAFSVDAMSGATVSSNAIRSAVSQALQHANAVLGVAGVGGGTVAPVAPAEPAPAESGTDANTAATTGATAEATEEPAAGTDATTEATTGATADAATAEGEG
ncbi:MAG: FMN-binding protein [Clostridiales bacterium]|nr:FMN-binding protein [Clostridiales bacterium]